MRLSQNEYKKGYKLDEDNLNILLDLGNKMIKSAPGLSKSMSAPVEIRANISFKDGTVIDNLKIDELSESLNDIFNSPIIGITIFSSNRHTYDELYFTFTFSEHSYSYDYTDTDKIRFTKYKNDIMHFFNNEIENSLLYRLLSDSYSWWFYPLTFAALLWGNYFLTEVLPLNAIASKVIFIIGSILSFAVYLLPKIFPRTRILFGVNKRIEEKQDKKRKLLWTAFLYPIIVFIGQVVIDNWVLK